MRNYIKNRIEFVFLLSFYVLSIIRQCRLCNSHVQIDDFFRAMVQYSIPILLVCMYFMIKNLLDENSLRSFHKYKILK